ncbi:MAG: HDIG domain-containing protein [Rhizobacter sp.]|nr:HDIG domain-containing protein [Chlorobiales bacterium]
MQFDQKFFRENKYVRLGIFVLFLAIVTAFFPRNRISSLSYEVGSSWLQPDVTAPFTFPVYKESADYEQQKREASLRVLPVFRRSVAAKFDTVRFSELLTVLSDTLAKTLEQQFASADSLPRSLAVGGLDFTAAESAVLLADYQRSLKLRSESASLLSLFRRMLPALIAPLIADGILSLPKSELGSPQFVIRAENDREESVFPASDFRDSLEAHLTLEELYLNRLARQRIPSGTGNEAVMNDTVRIALKLSSLFLTPNIIYDAGQTRADRARAVAAVPIADGLVAENEKIISRGEKITADVKRKLDSFLRTKISRETQTGELRLYLGKVLIIVIISALFVLFLYLFRDRVFFDNMKLVLIAFIILTVLAATWYSLRFDSVSPYLVPMGLASLLLTIIFDSRVGFFGTISIALLAAAIRGNDFSYAIASIFAGGLGVFTVRDIRHRRQIFISVLFVYLGYVISILAFNFARLSTLEELLDDLKFAGIGTAICFLVYPILLVIEKVFSITTDLTLLELSDVNHPLLKQMAMEAPGTYHHTLQVALLSEQAASEISANPLLCRVGAYFHDIGKLSNAEYFTENQSVLAEATYSSVIPLTPFDKGGRFENSGGNGISGNNVIGGDVSVETIQPVAFANPHDTLSEPESGRIIGAHVKDGVRLGRRKHIPEEVLDFIPQHHGTTVIHYFYDKAVQKAAATASATAVNLEDFRYPGPKPQSRETAIVMLADGVEASCRSLSSPNETTISKMIDIIIRKRLDEDQFSECPITFAEIAAVKKSFIQTLTASQHKRIKYPGQKI